MQLVEGDRSVTGEMMAARGLVDVLIPRGGAGLINAVVDGSKVPVIETGTGNCHLFVDASADHDMAIAIMLNAKVQRPSVCNALETLLVHAACRARLPAEGAGRPRRGGRHRARHPGGAVLLAGRRAGRAGRVRRRVPLPRPGLRRSSARSRRRSRTSGCTPPGHSETIITADRASADRFTAEVDAAAVLVNASSRFVDGGEFGFGAEIGISTQKLHARGPMGLIEMTSTKYIVDGDGQTRA